MMFYSVMSSYTVIRCNTIVYSILFFSVLSYHDIGFSWQYKKHEAIACIYIYIERETYTHTYIHTSSCGRNEGSFAWRVIACPFGTASQWTQSALTAEHVFKL